MAAIKTQTGQSVVEYLVFFSVIAVITLLSVCVFYPQIKESGEGAFQEAMDVMLGGSEQ